MSGIWGSVTGAADHLAGSTDEAVARTFDDTEGGGVVDGYVETVTGVADHAAGSTDEAVARTFDDTEGGGVIDGWVETATGIPDHLAGSTDEWVHRQLTGGGNETDTSTPDEPEQDPNKSQSADPWPTENDTTPNGPPKQPDTSEPNAPDTTPNYPPSQSGTSTQQPTNQQGWYSRPSTAGSGSDNQTLLLGAGLLLIGVLVMQQEGLI